MTPVPPPIVLGSASPRRRELLERAGLLVEVRAAAVDEGVRTGEGAGAYLERIVAAKLAAVRATVGPARIVVVADTAVIRDEAILGKPEDDARARQMLASLAGRTHRVATRFAVAYGEVVVAETVSTTVEFRAMAAEEIARYVATGEGRDKAGSYAIQAGAARFVRRIDGSYTNVVGLPLCEVLEALARISSADFLLRV